MPPHQVSILKFSRRAFLWAVVTLLIGLGVVIGLLLPLVEATFVAWVLVLAVVIISLLIYLVVVGWDELHTLAAATSSVNTVDAVESVNDTSGNEARLWSVFANAPVGMAFLDLEGHFLQVNEALCQLLGYNEADLLGVNSEVFVHPDEQTTYQQALARSVADHPARAMLEVNFRHQDGHTLWSTLGIFLVRDQPGQSDCFLMQFSERSQEKEMEEVLWQQLLRNELILQAATDGFCVLDVTGNILEVNGSFATITGYSQDELLAMRLDDLEVALGERPLAEYLAVVKQQDNLRFQTRCKRQDGVIVDLAASFTFINMGEVSYIFLSAADITAQKAAQAQIQESRRMLRLILDLIPTRVFWKDTELRYIGCNRQFARDAGLTADTLLGKTDYDIGWSQAGQYQADDRKVIKTGEPLYNIQETQDRPDGGVGWVNTHKIPLLDDDGTVIGVLGTYADVTQQKIAEDRMRTSEARLQAIFDNTAAGIVVIDAAGRYLQMNDVWLNLLGYTSAEMFTMTFAEVTYEPDRASSWENVNALLRQEITAYNQEKRYVCKDGRIFWAELTVSGLPDEAGEITAIVAVINDITERKAMETTLRQSEERYRALFEDVPVALWEEDYSGAKSIIDELYSQGITDIRQHFNENPEVLQRCIERIRVIDVNRNALELYNVPRKDEVLGPLARTLPAEAYPGLGEEILALEEGRIYFSREQLTQMTQEDSLDIIFRLSIAPGYEETWERVFISLTDVTALKQAQAAEHEQRTLAETLQDVIAALASSLDADEVQKRILENIGRVVPHDAANIGLIDGDRVRIDKWHGYPKATGYFMDRLTIPLDIASYRQMIESGEPYLVSHVEKNPNWVVWSELAWVTSYVAAPIKTHDEVIGFLNLDSNTPGFFTQEHAERLQAFADQVAIALENAQLYAEIRRYAEELEQRVADRTVELEYERAQLQAILEGVRDGVIYTEDWSVRYFNQQLIALTGYSPDEITGDVPALIHRVLPADLNLVDYFAETANLLRDRRVWRGTVPVRRADGSQFDASLSITLISEPGILPMSVVTLIRDVSQEKALQDQKDQFIANASHELRTPLANMKMRLYLLNKQPSKTAEHMRVLEIATAQMTELVENLLDLSRFERGAIILQSADVVLQTLLINAVTLQQPTAEQKGLVLTQDVPAEPVHLMVDSGRMTQVLTNLIANAINYTPEGGTILLRLEVQAEHILIHVEDTGLGIGADDLDQIFEPFFRVNDSYTPGTGLGLPISREIIMLHDGTLTVTSRAGQGSTFTVKLPCTPAG